MSVKNFKIATGLDLDGLVLSNNALDSGLYWNSAKLSTEQYVIDAVAGVDVDLSAAAGSFLDYDLGSETLNVNASDLATELTTNLIDNLATQSYVTGLGYLTGAALNGYATESYVGSQGYITLNSLSAGNGIDFNQGTISANYGDGIILGQSNELKINIGSGISLGAANELTVDFTGYATNSYVDTAISNLIDGAPGLLDTLNEIAAAINDDENYATTMTTALAGKQGTLTAGNGIAIGNVAGTDNTIYVDLDAIAGTGITVNGNTLEAAPAYISSVDSSFSVSDGTTVGIPAGQLSLSDTITIASVELTDSVASVTAASDVFGDASTSAYSMGSAVTVGTLPTGADVADVFITLKAAMGAFTHSRTSKLTYVNTGGDAPTWTEYGIINSGSFPATTISFDSSGNIIANVTGSDTYSVKGVVTILK